MPLRVDRKLVEAAASRWALISESLAEPGGIRLLASAGPAGFKVASHVFFSGSLLHLPTRARLGVLMPAVLRSIPWAAARHVSVRMLCVHTGSDLSRPVLDCATGPDLT
jgi:hypothetical protein